jgi:hypothetical protein
MKHRTQFNKQVETKNLISRNINRNNNERNLLVSIFETLIAFLLKSCTVHKYHSVHDGSRADGTLSMFYEYGFFDKPIIHWDKTLQNTTAKCKNWGYSSAEFFGRGTSHCNA